MKRSIGLMFFILLAVPVVLRAQDSTPTPAAAPTPTGMTREEQLVKEKEIIEKERELLEARRKYLKEFQDAFAADRDFDREKAGGKTTFADDTSPVLETVSLSYEAIGELSKIAEERLRPILSGYDRVVIHNEADFRSLSQYRMFREQSRMTLESYDLWRRAVDDATEKARKATGNDFGVKSVNDSRSGPGGFLLNLASTPSLISTAVTSVAQLISLFRTDRTITQSSNIVQDPAIKAVFAGMLLRAYPQMRVYNPDQFTPEYDISAGERDLLYGRLVRLDAAEADIDYYLSEYAKQTPKDRADVELTRLAFTATLVKRQIRKIAFASAPQGDPPASAGSDEVVWFRQMLAAEKLASFLERPGTGGAAPRAGILWLHVLSSGGSRRESRNLLLGTKTDYSGSAVLEIAVYDLDGTMRFSDVLSHHMGFKKFKTGEK